jgi:hypothetical protein
MHPTTIPERHIHIQGARTNFQLGFVDFFLAMHITFFNESDKVSLSLTHSDLPSFFLSNL